MYEVDTGHRGHLTWFHKICFMLCLCLGTALPAMATQSNGPLSTSLEVTAHPTHTRLEMWANAQRDGRPAEYRWHPLFNAAVWLTPTTRVPCSNAAKTRNPLKFAGVPQTNETISAASGPKFTILWGDVEEILLLSKFFSDCRYMP